MDSRAWNVVRRPLAGPIVVILGMFSGCGTTSGPTTYPVRGTVVFPGGQPWTGGIITFKSTSDPGMMASGDIQADGSFTLTTYYVVAGKARTKSGAVAGEHTVTIEEPERAVGRGAASEARSIILPKKYQVEAKENSLVVETPRPARR